MRYTNVTLLYFTLLLLTYHMFTDFGADSSSRFPFRARTNRQTDATQRPTDAGGYIAGVGDNYDNKVYITTEL